MSLVHCFPKWFDYLWCPYSDRSLSSPLIKIHQKCQDRLLPILYVLVSIAYAFVPIHLYPVYHSPLQILWKGYLLPLCAKFDSISFLHYLIFFLFLDHQLKFYHYWDMVWIYVLLSKCSVPKSFNTLAR